MQAEEEVDAPPAREAGRDALDRLLPEVYRQLHRLASGCLRRERPEHTLQTTALVNEAYLRLAGSPRVEWQSRSHFFCLAARLMRRILVDHERGRRRLKRGSGARPVPFDATSEIPRRASRGLIELDDALGRLAQVDSDLAEVVELMFFTGMTQGEVATLLGVSESTVNRRWRMARAWLIQELA